MIGRTKGNKKKRRNKKVRGALLQLRVVKRFMTEKEYQEAIKCIREGIKR